LTSRTSVDVLVVGTSIDPHIEAVTSLLPGQLVVARLDVDQYPCDRALTISLSSCHRHIDLEQGQDRVDLTSAKVVWFRRFGPPVLATDVPSEYRRFCLAEAEHLLDGVISLLRPSVWINEYWSTRRASTKPYQYSVAADVGFVTPQTLITNSASSAAEWIANRSEIVAKTLSTPIITDDDDERGFALTHVLSDSDKSDLQPVSVTATQFQDLIDVGYELRITSIGDKNFAVRIDSEAAEVQGVRDWRSEKIKSRYSWCELPSDVDEMLTRLHRALGLSFAASDLIVDEHGKHYFLETNPHGRWRWLEKALGSSPITEYFAEYITKGTMAGI
jgi:hypothetical protein